jgi:hypothetical protein
MIDYNKEIEKVCIDFLYEKIEQRIKKSLKEEKKSTSTGLKTEESMRNLLDKIWEAGTVISDNIRIRTILSFDDFLKAGLPNKKSYLAVARDWGQCDFVFQKAGENVLYGEIKTTTSSLTNTCHLINVGLTSLRVFNKPLISIIMYPDKNPDNLRNDYEFYVKNLYKCEKISEDEKDILLNNFFILTNQTFDTPNGIKKKLQKLNKENLRDFKNDDDIINKLGLFSLEDINFSEWERLIDYINELN